MHFEKLIKELESELQKDPVNDELMNKLAIAKMETRDFEGALDIWKKVVKIKPSVQTLNNLGYFYLREGEPGEGKWFYREKKAIETLEKATKFNPKTHITYSLLGEAYLKHKQFDLAETELKKAISIKSTVANQNNLGVALFEQDKYMEASKHFRQAHLLGTGINYTYLPYLNYGVCLSMIGEFEEAEIIAKYLMNNNEVQFTGYINLIDIVKIFYFNRDYKTAVKLYPVAFREFIMLPEDFGMYLQSLFKLNMEREAENFFNKIIKDFNNKLKAHNNGKLDDNYKLELINSLKGEIQQYRTIYNKLKKGAKLHYDYHPYIEEDCYLFGCIRHNISYQIDK